MTISDESKMFMEDLIGTSNLVFLTDLNMQPKAPKIPRPKPLESTQTPGILCYQWNGENFEAISEAIKENLAGYLYRKEDDLIIDYDDGCSVKRVKPLDWILMTNENSDLSVVSDNMMNIINSHFNDAVDLSGDKNSTNEQESCTDTSFDDQGVSVRTETQYGDKVRLLSRPNIDKIELEFKSYTGASLEISHSKSDNDTVIHLQDQYGNKLYVSGSSLSAKPIYAKTTAQLYETVHDLAEKAQGKVTDTFLKLDKYIDMSKEKAM